MRRHFDRTGRGGARAVDVAAVAPGLGDRAAALPRQPPPQQHGRRKLPQQPQRGTHSGALRGSLALASTYPTQDVPLNP